MAKGGDDGGGGDEPKTSKPTAVSRLVKDPDDIKHAVAPLVDQLRRAPGKAMTLTRGDAAMFLWDIALNDKSERARLSSEDVAVAAVSALRKGDRLDRSSVASLLARTSSWPEARLQLVTAGAPRELCSILRRREPVDPDDTDLARFAAATALTHLSATGDLRESLAPTLDFPAIVDAARPPPAPDIAARESQLARDVRRLALELLHKHMDPTRNPAARKTRAAVFRDGHDALATFAAAASDPSSRPDVVIAAVRCLADLAHDEVNRDVILAHGRATAVLLATLRDPSPEANVRLDAKAACAAAFARLASTTPAPTPGLDKLRVSRGELEWALAEEKSSDEISTKEKEERVETRTRVSEMSRALNAAMLGPPDGNLSAAEAKTAKRTERVLELRRAGGGGVLAALCRLMAPPGVEIEAETEEENVVEQEEEDEEVLEEDGEEGEEEDDEGGEVDGEEDGEDDAEDDEGGHDASDDAEEDDVDRDKDGNEDGDADNMQNGLSKKMGKKKCKRGKKGGKKSKGPKTKPGQAEAYAHAARALRMLSLEPSCVEHMREMKAHEYLLWHVEHSSDAATRRNARAALVNMTSAQATRDALKALEVPVPDYIFSQGTSSAGGVSDLALEPALAAKLARLGPGFELSAGHAKRTAAEEAKRRAKVYADAGKEEREETRKLVEAGYSSRILMS